MSISENRSVREQRSSASRQPANISVVFALLSTRWLPDMSAAKYCGARAHQLKRGSVVYALPVAAGKSASAAHRHRASNGSQKLWPVNGKYCRAASMQQHQRNMKISISSLARPPAIWHRWHAIKHQKPNAYNGMGSSSMLWLALKYRHEMKWWQSSK